MTECNPQAKLEASGLVREGVNLGVESAALYLEKLVSTLRRDPVYVNTYDREIDFVAALIDDIRKLKQ